MKYNIYIQGQKKTAKGNYKKMKRIRIAQIGTSKYSHGSDIFRTLCAHEELFDIAGYAMPEGEREKFPAHMPTFEGHREMTVDEIMNDTSIEAVVIETEEIYLFKYALMAAEHKKHIHMEKPGGLNEAEFEKIIETVSKNSTVFHTGYMYRYNPCIKEIIGRIKAGEIGDIISVEAHMSGWRDEAQTKWLKTFPGGMMFYLGCHLIDLVYAIQGMPEKVLPFNRSTGVYDTDAKDFSMAVFEYKNGASFVKTTQAERGGFLRRQLVITGTKGKFEIRPLEISVKYPIQYTEYTECMSTDWNDPGVHKRSEVYHRYDDMMVSFGRMVLGEIENPYTYAYELELYKLLTLACM